MMMAIELKSERLLAPNNMVSVQRLPVTTRNHIQSYHIQKSTAAFDYELERNLVQSFVHGVEKDKCTYVNC